jgi:hypothetical protein
MQSSRRVADVASSNPVAPARPAGFSGNTGDRVGDDRGILPTPNSSDDPRVRSKWTPQKKNPGTTALAPSFVIGKPMESNAGNRTQARGQPRLPAADHNHGHAYRS